MPVDVSNVRLSRGGWGSEKPSRLAGPLVEVVESGDHGLDGVANPVVVVDEPAPLDLRRDAFADRGDDGRFGTEVGRGRFEPTARRVHHAHRILDRDELFVPTRAIDLGAAEAGDDQRGLAAADVRTIELRRHLHRQPASCEGVDGRPGVRGGGDEVAAHGHEHVDLAPTHGTDGVDGVVAGLARGVNPERGIQRIEEGGARLLPDAHGAVALHVAVPADRTHPCSRLADVAGEQQRVHHLANGRHRVAVLGESHGPTHDRPVGPAEQVERLVDVVRGQAGGRQQRRAVERTQVADEVVGALAVRVDEGVVERVLFDEALVEQLEQREVAGHLELEVDIRDLGAPTHQIPYALRVLEADQSGLPQRVDRDDAGPALLRLGQGVQHAGVVRARVLADHEDQLGGMQILEGDAALADADGLAEGGARRLVAHVRAVRQVVGAEGAHEQLVEEGGLVARSARRVEHGTVGIAGGLQRRRHQVEGVVPADLGVVVGAGCPVGRPGQASLLSEPVVAPVGELIDRMRSPERGVDAAGGRLLGDRLRPVLAELGVRSIVRLGPRAAGAVEAAVLVHLQQGLDRSADAHLLARGLERSHHPRNPCGHLLRRRDAQVTITRIVDGCILHDPTLPQPRHLWCLSDRIRSIPTHRCRGWLGI